MDDKKSFTELHQRVRLQVFNQVSRNGCVYIADTKEDVEKLFSKFIDKKAPLILTNKCQDDLISDHHDIDYFKKFCTVELSSIAGRFDNIDIIETGEIGLGNKPVFEVWGDMEIHNSPNGDFVKSLMDTDVMTFGMRSIGAKKFGTDFGNLDNPPTELGQVISFDLIRAHPACKLENTNNIQESDISYVLPEQKAINFDYEGDDISIELLGKRLMDNHKEGEEEE